VPILSSMVVRPLTISSKGIGFPAVSEDAEFVAVFWEEVAEELAAEGLLPSMSLSKIIIADMSRNCQY
jgi:hypothetical protein